MVRWACRTRMVEFEQTRDGKQSTRSTTGWAWMFTIVWLGRMATLRVPSTRPTENHNQDGNDKDNTAKLDEKRLKTPTSETVLAYLPKDNANGCGVRRWFWLGSGSCRGRMNRRSFWDDSRRGRMNSWSFWDEGRCERMNRRSFWDEGRRGRMNSRSFKDKSRRGRMDRWSTRDDSRRRRTKDTRQKMRWHQREET